MFDLDLAIRLAAAVSLGLLLGLERERVKAPETGFGGVRTFSLIALSGATALHAGRILELPWLAPLAFAALGALILASYVASSAKGEFGITTEVSALLAFVLGALCLEGQVQVAAAIAVLAVLLLTLKDALHRLAQRIEPLDVEATLRFAIIAVIVLPLLPDRSFGPPPLDALNPYNVGLMVVLISGLNFAGYLLVKGLGAEHGLGLTGLLGGLASSTALTLGFARRSRTEPAHSRALALGIVLAWTVMFARVIAEVAVVNRALLGRVGPAMGILAATGLVAGALLHRRSRRAPASTASLASGSNPLELATAIRFALLYAAISVGARLAQLHLGDAGLYVAGLLAGITDVDAITLSMANFAAAQPEAAPAAARTIGLAALSNTLAKCALAFALGAGPLRRALAPIAAALLAVGAAVVVLAGAVLG
jgi:uncharacterized membrane protein (DUF4010 family)